jgi:hypothetical protein
MIHKYFTVCVDDFNNNEILMHNWARDKCFHMGFDYYIVQRKKYFPELPSLRIQNVHDSFDNRIIFVSLCDKENIDKADILKKTLRGNLTLLDTYDHSIGNFSKLTKFREFLNSSNANDEDIICFIDAFDMLCTCYNQNEIISTFKSYNKDIIFGCETNCGPEHISKVRDYFINNENNRFLNGGFQMGYKNKLIEFHNYIHDNFVTFKNNLEIDRNTEQGIISQAYITGIFNVGIDSKGILCNNIPPDNFDVHYVSLLYPSFFTHVIRSQTNAKKFVKTKEVEKMVNMHFLDGTIKYNKHIDMFTRFENFKNQEKRYMDIVKYFTDFDRFITPYCI